MAKVGKEIWQHIVRLGASSELHSAALFWGAAAGCTTAMVLARLGAACCLLPCMTTQLGSGSEADLSRRCTCSADDEERHCAPGLPSQQLRSRDCGS